MTTATDARQILTDYHRTLPAEVESLLARIEADRAGTAEPVSGIYPPLDDMDDLRGRFAELDGERLRDGGYVRTTVEERCLAAITCSLCGHEPEAQRALRDAETLIEAGF